MSSWTSYECFMCFQWRLCVHWEIHYVKTLFGASFRSSRLEVFCKKGVLKNFENFTGKCLCQSLFFNKVAGLRPATIFKKETLAQVFSREICEIFWEYLFLKSTSGGSFWRLLKGVVRNSVKVLDGKLCNNSLCLLFIYCFCIALYPRCLCGSWLGLTYWFFVWWKLMPKFILLKRVIFRNISRKNRNGSASYIGTVTNKEQVFILDLVRYIFRFDNFYICADCKY